MLLSVALCLQESYCYVMKYMAGGNMMNLLCRTGSTLSEEKVQFNAAELFLAVGFLHECGIIHRWAAFVVFVCSCH